MLISFPSRIWGSFIPFPSYQVFRRGAYYSVEVISGKVAVISLNTMYFYDSNKGRCCKLIVYGITHVLQIAVGGCEYREPDDPGNLEFDWLEVQLKSYRQRGMQVKCMIISTRPFLTILAGLDDWTRTTVSRELLSRMCQYPW